MCAKSLDLLNHMPSSRVVQDWQQTMNGFGARLTGNQAHKQYINFLESELRKVPGLTVSRDTHTFKRWEAKHWNLSVQNATGAVQEVPTTFYYPYSGGTPAEGVSGELVFCGQAPGLFQSAAGKIAIVEMPPSTIPFAPPLFQPKASYSGSGAFPFPSQLDNPTLNAVYNPPDLMKAAQAGVLGVVGVWNHISTALAADQYLPFTLSYQGCPGLWVSEQTGAWLKKLASQQIQATLTLEMMVEEQATTDTIYAVLPGQNKEETIIVNTHTDGPNECEENGTIGLLALAHVFVTGHFQLPQLAERNSQATSTWLEEHRDLWDGKDGHKTAVAGVTIEHLGCTEWSDDPTHTSYQPTGQMEIELVYTGNDTMEKIYASALQGRTRRFRSITLKPANFYFGEGQPLFQVNIPTISQIPLPTYLCAVPPGGPTKLDSGLRYEQIETFAKIISEIDSTPTAALGKPDAS